MWLLAIAVLVPWTGASAQQAPGTPVVFADDFSGPALDEAKWVHTVENDFEQEAVDVVDGRLRMAAATVGTEDSTVKFHGVRTKEPAIKLGAGVAISFELDWNDQANGCYMTAGAYLCPTVAENPREEADWLRIQYIGVPPGKNGRCWVSVKQHGGERALMTEDWPAQREGRKLGVQRVQIVLDQGALIVSENGETILELQDLAIGFDEAYLYLQHTSHSNYRLREVFFDNVSVRQ